MINVTKRNGKIEPLDLYKFHKVTSWACEGFTGVSESLIELKSNVQFYDKIKTKDIHETLIKASAELISEDTPNYQYVASRLINANLRKEIYNSQEPIDLYNHIENVVNEGYYDNSILKNYDKNDIDWLNKQIDHSRDYNIAYAGMEQFRGKYLVKNRATKKYYETPQMAFMLIAMTLFQRYSKEIRLKYVKDFYDAISNFEISLPTPIMAGLRTPQRQFSSCVLIEAGDSLDSIIAASSSIIKYVSQKAGIGIGAGSIRAVGSQVRKGDATSEGNIPYYKLFQSATKSCSATIHTVFWHAEIEDLLVLKNNKGTDETRVRNMDYSIQFNKVMYERLLSNGNITLFCPHDVPDLYESFFIDVDKFRELYTKYENDVNIKKKSVPAIDLFSIFIQERKDTGRIYLQNVDHANDHGSFIKDIAPIRQSNLCQEVDLPTKPLNSLFDPSGEISLCTLSAINWGKIKHPKDFERLCNLSVRALDELLDYQNYPIVAAQLSTYNRRPLGIGIINLAYWLAKNDLTYQNITKEGLQKIHEYAEAWSYYLIKASVDLASEKEACNLSNQTKYSMGIMPIDTYKKEVDELVDPIYYMDWDNLKSIAKQFGIRNSTLMALMPAETSAQVSNSTNGIEPPRALVSIKTSKDGVLKQVVPGVRRLKNKYDLLWDQKSPEGYLKICAVLQKFIDQGISVNTSYNPKFYENEELPLSELIKHIIMFYKYGGKQLYYFNTNDSAGEIQLDKDELEDDENCDSCTI
jgi:ribonucleoside-diphosphate reductase alpha chain